MTKTYKGKINGMTIIGQADSIKEFIINQYGFKLKNIHEVELINGEWERVIK